MQALEIASFLPFMSFRDHPSFSSFFAGGIINEVENKLPGDNDLNGDEKHDQKIVQSQKEHFEKENVNRYI